MPLDSGAGFAGISNEREYYSDHYLAEILSRDLRGTLKRWREEAKQPEGASRTPFERLRALAGPYLEFRSAFEAEEDDARRASPCSASGTAASSRRSGTRGSRATSRWRTTPSSRR